MIHKFKKQYQAWRNLSVHARHLASEVDQLQETHKRELNRIMYRINLIEKILDNNPPKEQAE